MGVIVCLGCTGSRPWCELGVLPPHSATAGLCCRRQANQTLEDERLVSFCSTYSPFCCKSGLHLYSRLEGQCLGKRMLCMCSH